MGHPSAVRLAESKVKRAIKPYPQLSALPLEIHEFGLLSGEYNNDIINVGPDVRGAAWTLQAYAHALDAGFSQIFTWENLEYVKGSRSNPHGFPFIYGPAWVRGMLEIAKGGRLYLLDIETALKNDNEARALVVSHREKTYVIASIYNLFHKNKGVHDITFKLDPSLLQHSSYKNLKAYKNTAKPHRT